MAPCLLYGVYNIWFYYNIFSLVICVCGLRIPSSSLTLPRSLVLVWIGNNSSYSFSFPLHTAYIPYTRSTLYFFSFWFFSPESVETYCPRTKHLCIRHPLSHASFLLPPFFILPHWRHHPPKSPAVSYIRAHITILLLIQIEMARLAWQVVYHNMFGTKLKILRSLLLFFISHKYSRESWKFFMLTFLNDLVFIDV